MFLQVVSGSASVYKWQGVASVRLVWHHEAQCALLLVELGGPTPCCLLKYVDPLAAAYDLIPGFESFFQAKSLATGTNVPIMQTGAGLVCALCPY